MAVNGAGDGRLPCGQELEPLVAHVADGAPLPQRHVAGCEDCQRALGGLRELWDLVGVLAAESVEAPAGIDDAVLRTIRRELFLGEVGHFLGGLLPRVGRALLCYSGLIGSSARG